MAAQLVRALLRLVSAHARWWNVSGAAAYAESFSLDSQHWTTWCVRGEPECRTWREGHLRRLRLVRALLQVGRIPVARARQVLRRVDGDSLVAAAPPLLLGRPRRAQLMAA